MRTTRRADAEDPPWTIRERGAPSPARLVRLTRSWWIAYRRWALSELGGTGPALPPDVVRAAIRITGGVGAPAPISAARWATVAVPLAQQAAAAEVALLVAAGAPSRVLTQLATLTPQPRRGVRGRRLSAALGAPDVPAIGLIGGGVLEESLTRWAAEGVALIRSVPRDELADLPQRLAQIADSGARWETLRDELRERLDVADSRLRLIARDQVAKLNGRITQDLQAAAGIDEYTWRATRDDRVRASHLAQDGLVFRWDQPGPPVGFYDSPAHPGEGGQCRCVAEPVSPSWWRDAVA